MSYFKVTELNEKIFRLHRIGSLLGWDESVLMPSGAVHERALAKAELTAAISEKLSHPDVHDWIMAAEQEHLTEEQQRNLFLFKKDRKHATCLPLEFIRQQKLAQADCEYQWRSLRKQNNWKDYLPLLTKVIEHSREEAKLRSQAFQLPEYDAQLNRFFDGVYTEDLNSTFAIVRDFIVSHLAQAVDNNTNDQKVLPNTEASRQESLCRKVMTDLGFDWNRGRLDTSTHPFCTPTPGETRITTRYQNENFLISLMGTIHETGHALYEQNLLLPSSSPLHQPSMAIHEGQSLFYEMQIGGSPSFASYIAPQIRKYLGIDFCEEQFLSKIGSVNPSLIRVDADEFTYPLHVILRFEIEQALLRGDIEVADLPTVWNEKMLHYFGLSTEGNNQNGCMQDVHWNIGYFGYFPGYLLGAMSANQIFQAQMARRPQMRDEIRQGDFSNIKAWMTENVWQLGRKLDFQALLQRSSGSTLNTEAFKNYLTAKFLNS